ncbi:unnamed protein product [Ambrosiozyma monospora]|uniref:Unnamed protein product n=1 Tax=Ambrosiozyma monospora TaxID=43982 RepID=A0ACB5TUV5_AMBMO|nr:unnamed protein product [Ambrosiozyma monospora]
MPLQTLDSLTVLGVQFDFHECSSLILGHNVWSNLKSRKSISYCHDHQDEPEIIYKHKLPHYQLTQTVSIDEQDDHDHDTTAEDDSQSDFGYQYSSSSEVGCFIDLVSSLPFELQRIILGNVLMNMKIVSTPKTPQQVLEFASLLLIAPHSEFSITVGVKMELIVQSLYTAGC